MITRTGIRHWQTVPNRTSPKGRKNLAWVSKNPAAPYFVRLDMQHPKRRPKEWNEAEFYRRGYMTWPKEVGFYNTGDNWELTPEFSWRFYLHNRDKELWYPKKNEEIVVSQMPLVEIDPAKYIPRVEQIFKHHIKRFGHDHIIYNAVMQARGFARDFDGAEALFNAMKENDLEPSAQSYVNMIFASRMTKKPIEVAKKYWADAVKTESIVPVLREDFEFEMWLKQIDRMGSFTTTGFLSNNEEGASEFPSNVWATNGWDERSEPKFPTRKKLIRDEAKMRASPGKMVRTTFSFYERRPWYHFKGMYPWDYYGPPRDEKARVEARVQELYPKLDADIKRLPYEPCGKAIPV